MPSTVGSGSTSTSTNSTTSAPLEQLQAACLGEARLVAQCRSEERLVSTSTVLVLVLS